MQWELAFLERPAEPDDESNGPWDQIDPQAQIAAVVLLSRLIGLAPVSWRGESLGLDALI
jgi:hypothetical protein